MESKCLNSEKCYYDYGSTECKNARAVAGNCFNCFRGKVLKEVNDFSKAEVGQDLYSLAHMTVKCCTVTQAYIQCATHDGAVCKVWRLDGSRGELIDNVQDLYWRRPEIIFQPDPVKLIKKEIVRYVNLFVDSDGDEFLRMRETKEEAEANAAKCEHICLQNAYKITIPFEKKE